MGTDNVEFNGEFPLRRAGSDSSLKSSVSTISSFSYASAERTLQARSCNGSSRRSHVSDIESILDDLDQEESSVDPEISDDVPNTPDEIPINSESRALSLGKKRNTRTIPNDSQGTNSPKLSQKDVSKSGNFSPFVNNNNTIAPPEVARSSLSPSPSSGVSLGSSPIRFNGKTWSTPPVMAKSPVIDRSAFPYPSRSHDWSDSIDSDSSTSLSNPGHKTPGSINLMQQRVNGASGNHGDSNLSIHGCTNGLDSSPQVRRRNLRRGLNPVEHKVAIPLDPTRDHESSRHRKHVTIRSRSGSFDSLLDNNDATDFSGRRSNDVETFHALIKNTRGTRGSLYTREAKKSSSLNQRLSKSEEILHHEPREIFSMELDTTDTSTYGSRDSHVTSGNSGVTPGLLSYQEAGSQNIGRTTPQVRQRIRRKLNSEYLASLKNLHASSC